MHVHTQNGNIEAIKTPREDRQKTHKTTEEDEGYNTSSWEDITLKKESCGHLTPIGEDEKIPHIDE